MPLRHFHPAVARWFEERIGTPTEAQRLGWEAIREGRHTLIAAPTGSGKTLAAFLNALDQLITEGAAGELPDEVRVVYVSPLKALSADIHRNLAEPRREIRLLAEEMGLAAPRITAAIRTGDTPAAERAAMLRRPPHILVTTPESLYLLLTAERSRQMLRTVRTVIVDEIHAMIETRRGAHLSLSLERLQHVAGRPLQRIGLSATQRPVAAVAAWLVGGSACPEHSEDDGRTGGPADRRAEQQVRIIDRGHARERDLAIELPGAPLEAVMSGEVWTEVYDRITELVKQHRTTLIFVNTRRLAERLARQLGERLGPEAVTAHHGSLAREARLAAEERLKTGQLRALVATASLELGIDIGHVDLVCQIASPRRINTFLQRIGRSGHTISGTPKGRLFPLTRDDLIECAALLRAVRRGDLDRLTAEERPLDVLAQQVVAESASEDWGLDGLYRLCCRAWPYRDLSRQEFDEIVSMVAQGYTTRRGRRGALVHLDTVNGRVRGRRGARLTAITSGGAIPENADYRVVLEPEGVVIGTLNEDFAIESSAGDIFQLGNASWRILQVIAGTVRVEDARGEPPTIPFWLGEAPARSDELSRAVADLLAELDQRLDDPAEAERWLEGELGADGQTGGRTDGQVEKPDEASTGSTVSTVPAIPSIGPSVCPSVSSASSQIVAYLAEARRLLGALPSRETLITERFFDEAGGMQLVIHSPFGARVNRAWGLALRKRFCRQFNFELQAAATDEALLLSLGPQHSFPLGDVFRFLHPASAESVLVQALLDAPMFGVRWRWNANVSLAVPRSRSGARIAPQLQRMMAEDLLAAVFPDAAACLENIAGDRQVPDHPLARQAIADCLHQVMDVDGLNQVLERIHAGTVRLVARDLPEPSPLAHEILNAKPYSFLDDAPLEERRTQAVRTRRALDPASAADLGALDQAAIDRVRQETWPDPRDADEMHDALLLAGWLSAGEVGPRVETKETVRRDETVETVETVKAWPDFLASLEATGRAGRVTLGERTYWVATERRAEFELATGRAAADGDRATALVSLLQSRLEVIGPTTASELATSLGIELNDVDVALAALERHGIVLRGSFTSGSSELEWCDRRLLARIHRYTLNRLRAEIAPVSAAEFMRFLFAWQRVEPEERVQGLEGLAAVIAMLDGYELPAAAWESEVLAARVEHYDQTLLDLLSLTGRVGWGRLSPQTRGNPDSGERRARPGLRPIRSTPVGVFLRESAADWLRLMNASAEDATASGGALGGTPADGLSSNAQAVLEVLTRAGASFFHDVVRASGLLASQVEVALAELAACGLVTSDSFAGLRALLVPSNRRGPIGAGAPARWRRRGAPPAGLEGAGRWSLLRHQSDDEADAALIEKAARSFLQRYGIVFRRLLARESVTIPWRQLGQVYRRLEARGEIRGGRFVNGMSGEQFALPEAVERLRAVRRSAPTGRLISISAADPLNLVGIITPGARVAALRRNRIVFQDGVPLAAEEGGELKRLGDYPPERAVEVERALVRRLPHPQPASPVAPTA